MKNLIKLITEAEQPKKKTSTKTKTDTGQDSLNKAFQRSQDYPTKHEPEKKTEPPKTEPKLRTASASRTRDAMKGVQMPAPAAEKLSRMKVDVGNEPEIPVPTYELVKPETLPNVINTQMKAAGLIEPEWHMIRNLPGYMVQAIRALGRPLFQTQTKTQLEKILCLANLMGQGPNTQKEINAVVKWAKENGKDIGHGDIDFQNSIPDYGAEIHQFATKTTRFMLVKDEYGAYVYAWPEQDSITPVNQEEPAQIGQELKRLAESLHYQILKNKRTVMNILQIDNLIEDFEIHLDMTLMESEQKIQFLAQQFGEKLKAAIQNDTSQGARQMMMVLEKQPDILVRELAKADPSGERHDYLQWITRMYIVGQFRLEDIARLNSELTKFMKFKSKIQNKDLNSYKSLTDFYDVIEKAEAEFGEKDLKSKAKQEKEAKLEGAEVIVNEPDLKIVKLLTPEAACLYAAGTRWCTSSADTFKHYAKQDDIYVILAKFPTGPRKFQMHYQSEQVMDERDASIGKKDIAELSKLQGWSAFLNYMIEKKYSKYFNKDQPQLADPKKKAARAR
jgi:hypothetical protein